MQGYYRFPAIHNDIIIFTAEGDLWKLELPSTHPIRLTTHHGMESHARISPDGSHIAFCGQYEGYTEVYLLPIEGGIPKRLTYTGTNNGQYSPSVIHWVSNNEILISTGKYSTLPNRQLVIVDIINANERLIELHQADQGCFEEEGHTLFFTRLPFQGSHTRRYKGGSVQQIWKFQESMEEAVPLTQNYPGTSKDPMWYQGKLYFVSDRDGMMNIWSMDADGNELNQHTYSKDWDIKTPNLHNGNIIYQKGADLYILDLGSGQERLIPIHLISDFDQRRTRWIKFPQNKITSISLSAKGDKVVIVSRGRIFVAPVKGGRWREITRQSGIRCKSAKFLGNSHSIYFLSDESKEMEIWKVEDSGMEKAEQLTHHGAPLILNMTGSPDGTKIAYLDKDARLYLLDLASMKETLIEQNEYNGIGNLSWSPDSKWLAYCSEAENTNTLIKLFQWESGEIHTVTSERVDSFSPRWSTDAKWLYFLSDRSFTPVVQSPWGPRQPEPFYHKLTKIYAMDLSGEARFPFLAPDELQASNTSKKNGQNKDASPSSSQSDTKSTPKDSPNGKKVQVSIQLAGLASRIYELPLSGRNMLKFEVGEEHLFWTETPFPGSKDRNIFSLKMEWSPKIKPIELGKEIQSMTLSANRKKLLVRKKKEYFIIDANGKVPKWEESKISLQNWTFQVNPIEDWQQLLIDAWRLERDYFYDQQLHQINWEQSLSQHLALIDRITDRYELDDLISHMVAELSTLHTYVYGGDKRNSPDRVSLSSLGASLRKRPDLGGYEIEYIYQTDPNYPAELSPLARPHLSVKVGHIITSINGITALSTPDPSYALSQKYGQQVRLEIKDQQGHLYHQIIYPITIPQEQKLKYRDWEYTRRLLVEKADDRLGYVHLQAMTIDNYTQWMKEYYPVFTKKGLIIDVRHNQGGNIDSWILEKLLRKAWFYWQPRQGRPYWNMQYAFRGHMVVLIDEITASDGEAFAEGFRRLGLGKIIGTRTWGGEIWFTSSNRLVDNGIATAAEFGVYTSEGIWLIEGHGVEPDILVDNLPHSTFHGKDAQLEAAIYHLQELLVKDNREVPPSPPYPNKSKDFHQQY